MRDVAFDDFKAAYKAGVESGRQMPLWQAVAPFFGVGIYDVVKALRRHDMGDVIVSATIWCVAAPVWMWWTRRNQ